MPPPARRPLVPDIVAIAMMALLKTLAMTMRTTAALAYSSSSNGIIPSWDALRVLLPESNHRRPAVYVDGLPDDYHIPRRDVDDDGNDRRLLPILYRDGYCVDVASETVWLGLECKGVEYVTVLVFSSGTEGGGWERSPPPAPASRE